MRAQTHSYQIRENALNLFKSYLSDRNQFVSVLDEKSDLLPVKFGVPQGSVFGPLLFLLYMNDISNIKEQGKIILFADDTNIFVTGETSAEAYTGANKILIAICKYIESNLLHINSKNAAIYFLTYKTEGIPKFRF